MSAFEATGKPAILTTSDGRTSLSLAIKVNCRSGRKLITHPTQETAKHRLWDTTPTPLQSALARGHRWLRMLESGEAGSLREIAQKEGVDNNYVSRMVNLTTLAPDIVAAILDERVPPRLTLFDLAVDPPRLWQDQRDKTGLNSIATHH